MPKETLQREFLKETGETIKVRDLLPIVHVKYRVYTWGEQQTLVFRFTCELIMKTPSQKDHHVR
jgi:hypothetical protein